MLNCWYSPTIKEQLWDLMEQNVPGIRDIFETYVVALRMRNYHGAFTTINGDKNKLKEKIVKLHLYSSTSNKIFTLYYNTTNGTMYVRNVLNEVGRLKTSSMEKINVESIEHFKKLIQQAVIDL